MSRKTFFWIGGIGLILLFGCGALFVFVGSVGNIEPTVTGDAVALVRIEGVILPGEGDDVNPLAVSGGAYSTSIIDYLKQANTNDQIKAIVLVVDSPGGSVYASDEVALQVAAMDKPILAAMGSVAASGGYYVSAPADEIWASPHTLTCSIGVIIQFVNIDELAAEYGVDSITYKSGQHKDMGNPFTPATAEEDAIWQSMIDEAYDAFVDIVAKGRDISEETVREMADGRICTGKQALELKLVDKLGYLPDVIQRAGELGGIDGEPPTIEYKREPGLLELLMGALQRPSPIGELRQLLEFRAGATLMYLYSAR